MARGNIAKENVEKKIIEAFGENFIAIHDKKIYVMANDGGEMCQIAISLTCPKTPVAIDGHTATGDYDFSETTATSAVTAEPKKQVEISQEEQESLADLLAKFGL